MEQNEKRNSLREMIDELQHRQDENDKELKKLEGRLKELGACMRPSRSSDVVSYCPPTRKQKTLGEAHDEIRERVRNEAFDESCKEVCDEVNDNVYEKVRNEVAGNICNEASDEVSAEVSAFVYLGVLAECLGKCAL